VVWLIIAWVFEKKPKFLGLLTGAVAGLATITPAAGFVTINSAVIIGCVAGVVCYGAVMLKNALGWDDALDVWGVHGVGGMIGIIMLGIFADKSVNAAGVNGLLLGGAEGMNFFLTQLCAIIISSIYAFAFTYFMLVVINFITPVRVGKDQEELGLDEALHGEIAYETNTL